MRKKISSLSLIALFWLTNILIVILLFNVLYLLWWHFTNQNYVPNDIYEASKNARQFVFWFAVFTLPFAISTLMIFRKFIRNLKNGQTFTEDNIRLLRRFCVGLVVVCVLTFLQKLSYYHFIAIPYGATDPTWQFNIWLLILALIISSMTYIFSVGQNLQKEKDLTI